MKKPRPFSPEDIDRRMAGMSESAATALALLLEREKQPRKQNDPTYPKAEVARWAARHLDLCSRTFQRPPPTSLVDLTAHLLDVSKEPTGNPRPPEFWRAADYLAEHPDSRDSPAARAVGVSNHTIKKWRGDPEFCQAIEGRRLMLKFGTE